MIILHCTRHGHPDVRVSTTRTAIWIGRGADNDVVLDAPGVDERHCRLFFAADRWFVVDHHSARGTVLGAGTIKQATAIPPCVTIGVGPFTIHLELVSDDETELALLATIALGDEDGRTVYADWLEEHGHAERAEYLRLQRDARTLPPSDPRFAGVTARLQKLVHTLDLHWRMKVARPIVESCKVVQEIACTMDWGTLAPTDDPKVRACGVCKHAVHYCTNEIEAEDHARRGDCVVLDLGSHRSYTSIDELIRRRGDGPMIMPGMWMPTQVPTHACPACRTENGLDRAACSACGRALW